MLLSCNIRFLSSKGLPVLVWLRRAPKSRGHAASARNCGYHQRNVSSSSLLRTSVQIGEVLLEVKAAGGNTTSYLPMATVLEPEVRKYLRLFFAYSCLRSVVSCTLARPGSPVWNASVDVR